MARPTKRRRTNGSIRFKRSKNLFEYRYFVGDTRKSGYAKTKSEADEKLNRALIMVADGYDVSDDPKFSDYADMWLEMKISMGNNLSLHTVTVYKNNVKHISGFIGSKKLSQIKPSHLEYAYSELLKRGLSPSSVNSIHRTVRTIWNSAFKKGIVRVNVTANTDAPSGQKRNPTILSRDQWKAVFKASLKEEDGIIIEFLLKTGMRIGKEALATTWDQIDFDSGTVTVAESKTDAGSFRTIPLESDLLERLKIRKSEQESKIDLSNPLKKFNVTNLVFCNSYGNVHSISNLRRDVWKRIKKATGVAERTTFHDLRHNAGSYLLSENVPITTVSKILGHANPSITLSIYAHEIPEDMELVRIAMSKFSMNKG